MVGKSFNDEEPKAYCIFDIQLELIKQAGIPMAMVGLLVALPGTPLFDRMMKEGRLMEETNDDFSIIQPISKRALVRIARYIPFR